MEMRRHIIYWFGGWLFDFTKAITVIAFLGLMVHYFFYSVLIVKGESMEPNYYTGDIMTIDRVHYRLHKPTRGEVIALYFPGEIEKKFIKRIIGLPGETITIRKGEIYINNQVISEPYIETNKKTYPNIDIKLHQQEYFILGDNRESSSDSRIWGPLPQEYILGVVDEKIGNTFNWKEKFLHPIFRLLPGRVNG